MKTGIERIAAERLRQIEKEGWTPEHDDEHCPEDLEIAAACYAMPPEIRLSKDAASDPAYHRTGDHSPVLWPWGAEWWKPSTRERDLEKAGALLAAALDLRMRGAVAESEVGV